MLKSNKQKRTCPICKGATETKSPSFPFCSERCRLLDLGQWANEAYRIGGEKVSEESGELIGAGENQNE